MNYPVVRHRNYAAGQEQGPPNGAMQYAQGCPVSPQDFIQKCEPYGMFPGCRVRWISFAEDDVPAGASIAITVEPQNPFVGVRLVVPSTLGIFFDLVNLQIGTQSQMAAIEFNTSAVVFSEVAEDVGLLMNFASNGTNIQLNITNTSGDEQDFRATIIGFTPPGSTLGG